ncbi:MAG: hypothetical protein CR974_01320 [Gammaproteobacteria bacterium]|nr:MAG: hypothetical protein CR974_01320 [Gammaproteobacteria bacterium]
MSRSFFSCLVFFWSCYLAVVVPAWADNLPANSQTINEQVKQLEKHLAHQQQVLENRLDSDNINRQLNTLPVSAGTIENQIDRLGASAPVTQQQVDKAEAHSQAIESALVAVTKRQVVVTASGEALQKAQTHYRSLQELLSNPINQANLGDGVQDELRQAEQLMADLQRQQAEQSEQLRQQQSALQAASELLKRWNSAVSGAFLTEQNSRTQDNNPRNTMLERQLERLQSDIQVLQKQLSHSQYREQDSIEYLQQSLYEKQTQVWLIGMDKQLLQVVERPIINLDSETLGNLPLADLEQQLFDLTAISDKLQALQTQLDQRQAELREQVKAIGPQETLEKAFATRQKNLAYQRLLRQSYPKRLSKIISAKKQAALFSMDALYADNQINQAVAGLSSSLVQMAYQVQISFKALFKHIQQKPLHTVSLACLSLLVIASFLRLLSHWFKPINSRARRDNPLILIAKRTFSALKRYSVILAFLLLLVTLVRASEIPYPSNHIIRVLVYTLVVCALCLVIIRIEYRLNIVPASQAFHSYVTTLVLAIFVVLYAVALMSAVAPPVLSLYEKGLMLVLALYIWVERNKLLRYLSKQTEDEHRAYHLYVTVLKLLPWGLIATCMVSLVGYGRLAWQVLGYIGVGTLYVIVLGTGLKLNAYWRKKLKLYSLKRFRHGAFIAGDIISPFSNVCKGLWIWLATAVLFTSMGWSRHSYLIAKLLDVVETPLVKIGATAVTIQLLALSALALWIIIRTAKWLKTFSYHWLYSRINDLGIRGSLSIFTQYMAVVIGVLIALNVLGIDLTSLAVFAGALGVGVGLGLQDIAKNFISGILLLIERPLRNGDWVSIDGNEGTVTGIGMRAITIETFDKQEVIIPNGNAIGNSFVNNTHSDSILRTVLYVGAGYDSDPKAVIAVIQNILTTTDGVLDQPKPQVVLWEYGSSSIDYRMQYYIDIDQSKLYGVRTEVLTRIWHEFKAHGIEIPFPQRDINIRRHLTLETQLSDNNCGLNKQHNNQSKED